jgi:hypothetical protein
VASGTRLRKLRRALLAGAFVVLLVLGFTAWQATRVKSALESVAPQLTAAVDHLTDGRTARAQASVERAQDAASTARTHSSGPVWWLASKLPQIGDDVTAVRVVSAVADDLTADTLPGLVEVSGSLTPESLVPSRGRIDLPVVEEAAPALSAGAASIRSASGRVEGLDTEGLIGQLRGPVVDLQEKLSSAASASEAAATAAELMPPMLGADGKRSYLMIFQNNAEIRAQGGMPGAMALLEADAGKLDMVRQGRPRDIGTFPDAPFDLTAEERELFTPRIAVFPHDTVFVPHFPRSSELLVQMWEARQPETVDGVLSLDPVALSYLLRATGPIALESGYRLTSANAVDVLMRDVYLEVPDDDAQNAIFDEAARKVFAALRSGRVDAPALLDAMTRAVEERRLMLWSDHPEEQDRITRSTIAGTLPSTASERPTLGMFVNDAASDKLSYYLDYRVDVASRSCHDGRQRFDVRLTARSDVPEGVDLPPSVVGPSSNDVPPGVQLNSFYLYSPVGGRIVEATLEGEDAPMNRLTYEGREVGAVTLSLRPGEERVVDYVVQTGPGQTGDPLLRTTPAARTTGMGEVGGSAC